jgi:small subunit ribosomal protein S6
VHRRVPKLIKYEFTAILDPLLDDAAVAASMEKYAKSIRDQGGEVTLQENWGRKKLAFEMHKKTEGIYVFMRMKATPAIVAEVNRILRFDEQVLRTLIVLDEEWEARNQEAAKQAGAKAAEPAAPAPTA